MVPVRRDDPVGAIGAYWGEGRQPDEEAIARLELMARATATAIESVLARAALTEALERQRFLLRELDHRCKNTLATVQSIADQTLRRAASPAAFVEAFNGRLGALARAHELLTQQGWGRAGLAEVAGRALAAFSPEGGERLRIEGPAVNLAPEAAVAMHMALHELAVNAAKYGALTAPEGQVGLSWRIEAAELVLTWCEQGGPPAAAPGARGFGSRLLERGIARDVNGRAEMDFQAAGLRYTLHMPLSNRVSLG